MLTIVCFIRFILVDNFKKSQTDVTLEKVVFTRETPERSEKMQHTESTKHEKNENIMFLCLKIIVDCVCVFQLFTLKKIAPPLNG